MPDYPPGATAIIFGSGFSTGETVQFQVDHLTTTKVSGEGHLPWYVVDGGAGDLDGQINGSIQTTWYVNPDDSLGATFLLSATGLTSGETATAVFTDAAITSTATGGNWSAASSWAAITRTGTITTSTSSTTVTGAGTQFTTQLAAGSILQTTGGVVLGTVASVTNNTTLTLNSNASSTNAGINYDAQIVPGAADTVTIVTGANVTVNSSAAATTLTLNAGSALTVSSGGALAISSASTNSGTLTVSGGTVSVAAGQDITNNGTLAIGSGTLTIGRDFLGSGTTNMTGGTLQIGRDFRLTATGVSNWSATGGTVEFTTVNAGDGSQFVGVGAGGIQFYNVAISGGNDAKLDTGGKTIKVAGAFTNTNTNANNKTWSAGTVVFNGSSTQSISAVTQYFNLTIDNAAGATLGGSDVTVANALTFTRGNITTGANTLTSGTNATTGTVSASGTTGWVVGNLKKFINNNAAQSTTTYEVGTATYYTPLTITPLANPSGTNAQSALIVRSTAGEHPNVSTSTIDPNKDVNSYWTVTGVGNGNMPAAGYTVKGEFPSGDIDPTANASNFIIERYVSPTWLSTSSPTRTPTSTQATVTFGTNTPLT